MILGLIENRFWNELNIIIDLIKLYQLIFLSLNHIERISFLASERLNITKYMFMLEWCTIKGEPYG